MDLEASGTNNVLERMLLDENAEPMNFTLSLLEDITDHFSLDCKIGSGGFAVVYKGTMGKLKVVVKKLTKTHELPESKFHEEIKCLMKVRHRNIVRFLGYCAETRGKAQDCEGRFVMADMRNWMLCFEYVPNGSLEKYITDPSRGLEWQERFAIIKGICHGLQYLHKNRILHLDLKPANILLDDRMQPKICDFGLSRCLDIEQTRVTTTQCSGTLGYLAPEVFSGKISFASDIYSLGIVILEILTGAKGYPEEEEVTESWRNRLEGDTELEQVRVCTKIGKECMEPDAKKRPIARHIIDMLDKTTSAHETGPSSSLVALQVNLLKEQYDQESIGELARSLKQGDLNELPETEDVAERLGNDHSYEGEENTIDWSSWETQDTTRKDNNQGTSIPSSNSSILDKLNVLKIFKRDADKNFVKNGGQHLMHAKDIVIFSKERMKKITRNYSALIGRGSFGNVYKGNLPDGTIVAVKTSVLVDNVDRMLEFVDMVQIQIGMIHKNILRFIGCCLETKLPMLVHEYAARSLREILDGNKNMMPGINLRLDIAIGSAEGLTYLHGNGGRHGDVRPEKILLDEKLTPKISTFKLSSLTTITVGRMGYMDPVYLKTGMLTLKGDVYSFGVVLLELITRKEICYSRKSSLIVAYRKRYEIEKSGRAMFDTEIASAEDISVLEEIGQLAIECLKEDDEERPDMKEVTERLVMIRRDRRLGKARNAS